MVDRERFSMIYLNNTDMRVMEFDARDCCIRFLSKGKIIAQDFMYRSDCARRLGLSPDLDLSQTSDLTFGLGLDLD